MDALFYSPILLKELTKNIGGFTCDELRKSDNGYEIKIDTPSVRHEDVSLIVEQDKLKLSAKRYDNGRLYAKTYYLPEDVDTSTVEAILKHGTLTITMKKTKSSVVNVPIKVL
jgi:HSP20 family molecular chaperone IbpA